MVTNSQEAEQFKGSAHGESFRSKPAPTASATLGAVEVRFVTSRHGAEFSHKQPKYAGERRLRCLQIFGGVLVKVRNGSSVARALREASRRWRGRTFKSAPGRRVNFSVQTLNRLWYRWCRFGDAALDLHYKVPPKIEVSPVVTNEVLQRAGQADIKSFSQLFKTVCNGSANPLPSRRTVERALPETKRQAISQLMHARRSASAMQRKAARQAQREIKRSKAALEKAERQAKEVLQR